ncbi:YjcZ family sporulation protein [Bacillus sp. FJAT-29790]|uniref:YjcZ family sporulation protein n=1 Tax=Bacillus sp. FJAT-29790 TaxID=1895002 RepID=UPI001C245226|nr:YjcZ family sporulation protein [Bacillus sp. FJAT-29790]MBU8878935.1 YjcZ family sporulation protein [Bacillus sp. FJAT-29790]
MYGGYGCGYDPCYSGYGYPVAGAFAGPVGGFGGVGFGGGGFGCGGFALIVVLFILLIIIGASCFGFAGCC